MDNLLDFLLSDWLEVFGFLTGLICVYLNAKENVWGWPVAMASVVLYAFVFYQSKLYADMGLQIFFFVLCAYGLYEWLSKTPDNETIKITSSNFWLNIFGLLATLISTGIVYFLLVRYTDSDLPFWDAFTTSMSIIAQILLARKKIENWIYWIVADCIYVGLYIYKGLFLTAVLYFIFIFLAYYGYLQWKKSLVPTVSK